MSDNDTRETPQSIFNRIVLALLKYQRAHQGRSPASIQLNAEAFRKLQPTAQRYWLHKTSEGWMFYDIPVREVPSQSELFTFRD